MAMPGILALVLWLLVDIVVQMQVYLEETHLLHRAVYQQCREATPRYLGLPVGRGWRESRWSG